MYRWDMFLLSWEDPDILVIASSFAIVAQSIQGFFFQTTEIFTNLIHM